MPLQPLDTLTQQPGKQRLQILVTSDADRRIAVEAARRQTNKGDVVSELAIAHLPPVDGPEINAGPA